MDKNKLYEGVQMAENSCGCKENSIKSVYDGIKLIKRHGEKCLFCLCPSIMEKVLKRVRRNKRPAEWDIEIGM